MLRVRTHPLYAFSVLASWLLLLALSSGCSTSLAQAYRDEAEATRERGQYDVAYANYAAAYRTCEGPNRAAIRAELAAARRHWLDALLQEARRLADGGEFGEAYSKYRQVVDYATASKTAGDPPLELEQTHQYLAKAWIQSLLPEAQQRLTRGELDPAWSLSLALEDERNKAGLDGQAVPKLAALLADSEKAWFEHALAQVLRNEPPLAPEEQLARLLQWRYTLHDGSGHAALEERLNAALDRTVRERLQQAERLSQRPGHFGAWRLVEPLTRAQLGGSEARQLLVKLRSREASHHIGKTIHLALTPFADWFHLQAAKHFNDTSVPDLTPDRQLLRERSGFSWQVGISGTPCPEVADELRRLPAGPGMPVKVNILIEECVSQHRTLFEYVKAGQSATSVTPLAQPCKDLSECRRRNPARLGSFPDSAQHRILTRYRAGVTATALFDVDGEIVRLGISALDPNFKDQDYLDGPARSGSPSTPALSEIQRGLGARLAGQLDSFMRDAEVEQLEEDARDVRRAGAALYAEDAYVNVAHLRGRLSSDAVDYFVRTYALSPAQAQAFALGRAIEEHVELPSAPTTAAKPPEANPQVLQSIRGEVEPLELPSADEKLMVREQKEKEAEAEAEAEAEQSQAEEEDAKEREQEEAWRSPRGRLERRGALGLEGAHVTRSEGASQNAGYLRMRFYDPRLFADEDDVFTPAFKFDFAPGANAAGAALDIGLWGGLSATGGPLTLTGMFGVGGNIVSSDSSSVDYGQPAWSLQSWLRMHTTDRSFVELGYDRRAYPARGLFAGGSYHEQSFIGRALYGRGFFSWGLAGHYTVYEAARATTLGLEVWL